MFRCDSCTIVLFICFLLYFDATVSTEKLEEKDRRLRSTSEKYRLRNLHDRRIETLIAGSEKFLRTSSSIDDGKKHFSSRRKNSWDDETVRRFGTLKGGTRKEKYKSRKNEPRNEPRNMRKSLTKKKKPTRKKITSIRGCAMKGNNGGKGYVCRGSSHKRNKRETNCSSIPKLNISCLPWYQAIPTYWPLYWSWFV